MHSALAQRGTNLLKIHTANTILHTLKTCTLSNKGITKKKKKKKERKERNTEEIDRVCWLVAQRPSNMLVYLKDGSAQTIVRAATLR